MTIERAFQLVHHLNVPQAKRRFWPRFSIVIVSGDESVPDVLQFFGNPEEQQQYEALVMYPGTMSFVVEAEKLHVGIDEFREKVSSTAAFIRKHAKQSR